MWAFKISMGERDLECKRVCQAIWQQPLLTKHKSMNEAMQKAGGLAPPEAEILQHI